MGPNNADDSWGVVCWSICKLATENAVMMSDASYNIACLVELYMEDRRDSRRW
jgi:hypothetical protein